MNTVDDVENVCPIGLALLVINLWQVHTGRILLINHPEHSRGVELIQQWDVDVPDVTNLDGFLLILEEELDVVFVDVADRWKIQLPL